MLALNAPAVPAIARRVADALTAGALSADDPADGDRAGADPAGDAVRRLIDLVERLGAPRSLEPLGLRRQDIPEAAAETLAVAPPSNPVPLTTEVLESLLLRAWAGEPPEIRPA